MRRFSSDYRSTLLAAALIAVLPAVQAATRDIDTIMPRLSSGGTTTGPSVLAAHPSAEFDTFRTTNAATAYDAVARRLPSIKASRDEFTRMQAYLSNMYDGVTVVRSFLSGGEIFDCIPLSQQPSLRFDGPVSTPPAGLERSQEASSARRCASGEIPLRRVTIDELAGHASLESFLSKEQPDYLPASNSHFYAHVSQNKTSHIKGGGAGLNLWKPVVDNQTMSLLQIWLVGGSSDGVQTAEVGWQVQPGAWNTYDPTVFEYWTANGYSGTGCYNLTCSGFVQTAADFSLGTAIPSDHYSVKDGKQTILNVQWRRSDSDGAWWMVVDGEAVGYLPASLYGQGQLGLADGLRLIDAGGEIARGGKPAAAMGSGAFAETGYRHAAFVTDEHYLDGNLLKRPVDLTSKNLSISPTPHCYTLALIGIASSQLGVTLPDGASTTPDYQEGMSGTSFYLGGPGTADASCKAAYPTNAAPSAIRG